MQMTDMDDAMQQAVDIGEDDVSFFCFIFFSSCSCVSLIWRDALGFNRLTTFEGTYGEISVPVFLIGWRSRYWYWCWGWGWGRSGQENYTQLERLEKYSWASQIQGDLLFHWFFNMLGFCACFHYMP